MFPGVRGPAFDRLSTFRQMKPRTECYVGVKRADERNLALPSLFS